MKFALFAAIVLVVASSASPGVAEDKPPSQSSEMESYISLVYFHLQHFKSYPASAHGAEGIAQVRFALDQDGNVATSKIEKSSGSEALDQEALDVLQRAKPFPRRPVGSPGSQTWFTAPINFTKQAVPNDVKPSQ